MKAERKGTMPT